MAKSVALQDQADHRQLQQLVAALNDGVILVEPDQTIAWANAAALAMHGVGAVEDLVGRTLGEVDVLGGAKQRELAMERLREHRTIPQMEAWPRMPDGKPHLVLVAGQPIEVGDDACMLLTFADLEPRRQAEAAHSQSERLFERAFRMAPVPMAVADLEDWFRFILVNEAFAETMGHTEADAAGRTAAELGLWDDPAAAGDLERRLREGGTVRDVGLRLRGRRGEPMDCLLSAEAVTIDKRPCALWAMQDVTERRRTEADLAAAIDTVMRDTSWFSRTVLEKLARVRSPGGAASADGVADLTPRGREVLGLVCRGLDDAAIAGRLGLSPTTVRNHVNDLYRRTDKHGRAALVVWARERGFAGAEPDGLRKRRHRSR